MVTPVKNIIFDLGGVLINLDYQLTRKAFEDLGVKDFDAFIPSMQPTLYLKT